MHGNDELKDLLYELLEAMDYATDASWSYKEYLVADQPRRKLYPWNGDSWLGFYWKEFELYGPRELYAQQESDEASD